MKLPIKTIGVISVAVLVGAAFFIGQQTSTSKKTANDDSTATEKKTLYWVAPMNPGFRSDKPGKSPMGMDLVPVYAEADQTGTIKINAAVENNIAIRTATVGLETIEQTINAVGYVKANDEMVESINSYSDGWVRNLAVKTAGEKVSKDQLLFKLYSPEVVSAEEEYLLALNYKHDTLAASGKKKLLTLGMSPVEIKQLTSTPQAIEEISIYSPRAGYVTTLAIKEGQHISPNLSLMTIADLATVWIIAEIYEKDATNLQLQQMANVRFPSIPGKVFQGTVDYIYPQLNSTTRTVKVRIVLDNPKLQLKPDMYANLTIKNKSATPLLAVPKEALIRLGASDRVILALGKGRFRSVPVKTGMENSEWVTVMKGLAAGDQIVTSSQFLLDSESSLKAGLSRVESIEDTPDTPAVAEKTMAMPMTHQHT